jgi:hypothetical protein
LGFRARAGGQHHRRIARFNRPIANDLSTSSFRLFVFCLAAGFLAPLLVIAAPQDPIDVVVPDATSNADATASLSGPDVIVGSLYQVANYGSSNGISAFAVGTYSCNVGDVWLNWFPNNNQHPVIAQNMFRLKGGRFEQIGQSWLKHGFYALSNTLCTTGCQPTDGTHLGVNCSDPYSAALTGTQDNLS